MRATHSPIDARRMSRRELGRVTLGAWLGAGSTRRLAASGTKAGGPEQARWRADFPALDQTVNDHPLVYLDSAATTQRPAAVLAALQDYYRHDNANPGSALHALARRAHEHYEGARRTVAEFIHASSPDEVVWVRRTTEGINLVASAWARLRLHAGDEILLTVAEHASNLLPWRLAAEQSGATIRYADVDDEGRIRLDDLERQLSTRTRLVSFSHVSNVAGYINPAAEICSRARRAGARVLIDAAQSAPHIPIDVQALGCDFLVFSGHKMLGPMGAGSCGAVASDLRRWRPIRPDRTWRTGLTSRPRSSRARHAGSAPVRRTSRVRSGSRPRSNTCAARIALRSPGTRLS